MGTLYKSCLLFALNWLDAQLTLVWLGLNVATEGNSLMAHILEHGELTFLGAKLADRWCCRLRSLSLCSSASRQTRSKVVLVIYAMLMLVHAATGCVALGWHGPITLLGYVESLPNAFLSLFI